jgi:hypothetical protein
MRGEDRDRWYRDRVVVHFIMYLEGGSKSSCSHRWGAVRRKVEVDLMKRAFAQFQKAAGEPKKITPELCIKLHNCSKELWGGLIGIAKRIYLASAIVNESDHR